MRTSCPYVIYPLLQLAVLMAAPLAGGQEAGKAAASMPSYRVEAAGFRAGERDIKAVCDSAGGELWPFFPEHEIEPFVVTRGHQGPIVLFDRNGDGEIVMRLDTQNTSWCQYAYQFAHEFCHVLCGFDNDYTGCEWFEETLCETASLFAMRAMARSWEKEPPYANWKEYRHALRNYTDDVIAKRTRIVEIYRSGLRGFYRDHHEELEKNTCVRDLNGAMSLVFLRLFEEKPERWEAIRWLDASPAPPGETFQQYLQKWYDAAPARHQPFVRKIADLYGIEITVAAVEPSS